MKSPNTRRMSQRSTRTIVHAGHAPPEVLRSPDVHVTYSMVSIDPDWRQALIAQAAYYRSERRGFEPGHDLEDWLMAEREIDAELAAGHTPVPSAA